MSSAKKTHNETHHICIFVQGVFLSNLNKGCHHFDDLCSHFSSLNLFALNDQTKHLPIFGECL